MENNNQNPSAGQEPIQPPQNGYSYTNGYPPPYAGQQPYPQPPAGGYPYPVYRYHTKSRLAAALLALVFGVFGCHNFYLNYSTKATIQLILTLLGLLTNIYSAFLPILVVWIWSFVEGIQIITNHENYHCDGNGIELKE